MTCSCLDRVGKKIGSVANWVQSPKVSKEIAEKRLKICQECDKYKKPICTQCGCVMPLKVTRSGGKCELKKWS